MRSIESVKRSIVGRDAELARIDAFLGERMIPGRVLVIEGEPGVGKSTLWSAGVSRAMDRSWRVLTSRPTETEATFAYAGLGDLLGDASEAVAAALPPPQRRALRVALLLEDPEGPGPEARAIAVAFLGALRELAHERPLLVAVDDCQWLDPASAVALAFAIRRVGDEAIAFLLAQRVDRQKAAGAALAERADDRLAIGPLTLESLRRILHDRLDLTLPPWTLRRIHETSGGNPLFALELVRAMARTPMSLDAGTELPIPDDLMALFADRLRRLPPATIDALAAAAALGTPDLELVTRAIDRPADEVLTPAVDEEVVRVYEGRVRFGHPLLAAAAWSNTRPSRRREIHARLADVVDEPEQRARHLALATNGPDEAVAAVLEDAAGLALSRGAPDAAAELAALAWQATPAQDEASLRRRRLAEATYLSVSGDFGRAQAIAGEVIAATPPGRERSQVLAQLGSNGSLLASAGTFATVRALEQAIAEAEGDERVLVRLEGIVTGVLDLRGEDVREALRHGYAELRLGERLGDEVHIATALRGIARNEQRLTGKVPLELIRRSLALEPAVQRFRSVATWPSVCHAEMLCWTDDLPEGLGWWDWLDQQAIERGQINTRIDLLARSIPYELASGAWDRALARAQEGDELTRDAAGATWARSALAADLALVAAHLGDVATARSEAQRALDLSAGWRTSIGLRTAGWALGHLELSLGHPALAHAHLGPLVALRRAAGVEEPGDMRFVTDEIEAVIGAGSLDEAEVMLDWFEGLARRSERTRERGACARCRGLLHAARGELDLAAGAFDASLERYGKVEDPFGMARTLLGLGELQRRRRHRREAREQLEAAANLFERLGARLWLATAQREIARIGGRVSSGDALTPGERAVALLVAEGRTNREAAAALTLTERTVEGHLSNIYAKLGLRSRAELARRLAADPNRGA